MSGYDNRATFLLDHYLKQCIFVSKLNRDLLATLADFFSDGLPQGDLCVAILTPRHKRMLNRRLRSRGIDIKAAARSEQYIVLNVWEMLPIIDFGKDFDEAAYYTAIEKISTRAAKQSQRIRAFGEISGLRLPELGLYTPQRE